MRCIVSFLFLFLKFVVLQNTSSSLSFFAAAATTTTTTSFVASSVQTKSSFKFEREKKSKQVSEAFGLSKRIRTAATTTLSLSGDSTSSMEITKEIPTSSTTAKHNVPNWRISRKKLKQDDDSKTTTTTKKISPFSNPLANWSKQQYQESLFFHESLSSCTDAYLSPLIQDALHTLYNAYRLYNGPLHVIGSYNGGKDAVVILHLMRAAHAKYCSEHLVKNEEDEEEENGIMVNVPRPRVIYFEHQDEFPQVLNLLHDTVSKFDLDMLAFEQGIKFGEGLTELVNNNYPTFTSESTQSSPYPMAFVLGTRTTDPNAGSQGKFAPSSHYMPPFMRINPILDWDYGHVWHFLRLFQLPYCSLYDEGYTSLGTIHDTLPCPALKKVGGGEDGDGEEYFPAYMLRDWDQERAGRIVVPKKSSSASVKNEDATADEAVTPSSSGTNTPNVTISQSSSVVSLDEKGKKDAVTAATDTTSLPTSTPSVLLQPQQTNNNNKNDNDDTTSLSSLPPTTHQKTVGLIIIGDEILKGLVPDTNTHAAASALREHNVPLSRVVVVSDDHDDIVEEIQRMLTEVDVIITSGGVGPTHDDVTIKSVSTALGRSMVFHEEMGKLLRKKMNSGEEEGGGGGDDDDEQLTDAQMKMATLPASSKLRYFTKKEKASDNESDDDDDDNDSDEWPILQCHNIFVLPGVPQFFQAKVKALSNHLSSDTIEKSEVFKIVLSIDESSIVSVLNDVVMKHPHVCFGSYPFVGHPQYKTVVTLEGKLFDVVADATTSSSGSDSAADGVSVSNSGRMAQRALWRSVSSSKGCSDGGDLMSSSSSAILFTKEEMDVHVRLALADLVNGMPEGSVLRVDNNDDLTF